MPSDINYGALATRTVLWVVLSTIGVAVGAFVGFVLLAGPLATISPGTGLVIGSLIFGGAVGAAQGAALYLGNRQDIAMNWFILSGFGFALFGGLLLGSGMVLDPSNALLGIIQVLGGFLAAIALTTVQWIFLRPKYPMAWLWAVAGVVGTMLLFALNSPASPVTIRFFGWLLYATLTGLAMAYIVRDKPAMEG